MGYLADIPSVGGHDTWFEARWFPSRQPQSRARRQCLYNRVRKLAQLRAYIDTDRIPTLFPAVVLIVETVDQYETAS